MGILTAGEILVLLLLHTLIRGFQITGSHLFPPLPLAITLLLLGAGTAFPESRTLLFCGNICEKPPALPVMPFAGSAGVPHHRLHHPENQRGTALSTAEISDEEAASFNDKGEITITGNCT